MDANVIWERTLRQFEIGFNPMLPEDWLQIEGLYEVTDAGAYGFLMEDPKDYSATHANGVLAPFTVDGLVGAVGVGYCVPVYKMHKQYSSVGSALKRSRSVTRPKSPSVIKRGGVTSTVGASAGNISIDYATGTVEYVADAVRDITAINIAGPSAEITLATAIAGLTAGKRIYIDGLTGTNYAEVNARSYLITNVASNVYTIDADWSAMTLYSNGTGATYPQNSETLTWAGDTYVPVQFANDELNWEFVRYGSRDSRLIQGPSILLDEVRE